MESGNRAAYHSAGSAMGAQLAAVEPSRFIEGNLRQTIDGNENVARKLRLMLERVRGTMPEVKADNYSPSLDNLASLSEFALQTAGIVNTLLDDLAERI